MRTTSHGRGARSAKNAAANIRRPKTDGKETATQDFSESGQEFRRADVAPSPRRRAEAHLRRTTHPPRTVDDVASRWRPNLSHLPFPPPPNELALLQSAR